MDIITNLDEAITTAITTGDIIDIEDSEAKHEFGALNTLFGTAVLILCIFLAYFIKKYRVFYVTESAMVIMIGIIVGYIIANFHPSKTELNFLTFQPEIFYFFLLPPIVFDAGYTCRRKDFFSNIVPILLFAVVGTFISTFFIAFCVFTLGKMNWIDIDTSSSMESLLFGAMISAVNPVATLSVMDLIMGSESPGENCDKLLYSIVFGESVLNDAVAINLFQSFLKFYESNSTMQEEGLIFKAILDFLLSSLGGVATGTAIGFAGCYFCKNTDIKNDPHLELVTVFLFAYVAYSFNEAMEFSGIMALFFCGIVLAHYNSYNLSIQNRATAEICSKTLATFSETCVFLYLGIGFFTGRFSNWSPIFIIFAIILCYMARFINIFPLSMVSNLTKYSSKKITRKMQTMIWFSGLPGAISFALSQSVPGKHHDLFVTTTLSVVIFSTVVMGGLTAPMLTCTEMRTSDGGLGELNEDELDSSDDEQSLLVPKSPTGASLILAGGPGGLKAGADIENKGRKPAGQRKGIRSAWRDFEDRYIKPVFGGSSSEAPSPISASTLTASAQDDSSGNMPPHTPSSTYISHRKGGDRSHSGEVGTTTGGALMTTQSKSSPLTSTSAAKPVKVVEV